MRGKKAQPSAAGKSLGAERLRQWRGERNQSEVCGLVGVDQTAFCAFETGYKRPGLLRAVQIQRGTGGFVTVESWLETPKRRRAA